MMEGKETIRTGGAGDAKQKGRASASAPDLMVSARMKGWISQSKVGTSQFLKMFAHGEVSTSFSAVPDLKQMESSFQHSIY